MTSYLQYIWIALVLTNFALQMLYFFFEKNNSFYLGKRITTPVLLFGGMVIVLLTSPIQWIPAVILALMGLGEIGIEGSSVVEKSDRTEKARKAESLRVTIAGVLFLLVNVLLGALLFPGKKPVTIIVSAGISVVLFALLNILFEKCCDLNSERKFQTRAYSLGLVVLAAGVLCEIFSGLTTLGLAALILTISDTLVLIRMAANWNKKEKSGFILQFLFLIVILFLYYFYMAVLSGVINSFTY